jgi:serpin B
VTRDGRADTLVAKKEPDVTRRLVLVPLLLLPLEALATPEGDLRSIVDGSAGLGSRLYGVLRNRDGNLFFSPASISWALAMTHAGARGATARQMARLLGLRLPATRLDQAHRRLLAALRGKGKGGVELAVANALWGQRGRPFLPAFRSQVAASHDGHLEQLDFEKDPAGARATINSWVRKRTRGKIDGLLAEGSLNQLTRLVLTNAVYFKGVWTFTFPAADTRDEPFRLGGGRQVTVPLMRLTESFRYRGNRVFQVLELPYRGGTCGMVILLPRQVGRLGVVERYLRPAVLRRLLRGLPRREVQVQLPRFSISEQLELTALLKAMGMRDAFVSGRADLSGMDGTRELYLWAALHRAWVEVNEEGTEAAAATAVIGGELEGESEPDPPLFRADRPFLFLIRHRATGAILFVGRLSNPGGVVQRAAPRTRKRQ